MTKLVNNIGILVLTVFMVITTTVSQSQSFPIGQYSGQTINTCSGTFYDAGGAFSGYTFNEDYSISFCSSDPLNTHIKLYFSTFNILPGDTLFLFDGPNLSSPLLGAYNNSNNPVLQPRMASINNPSGCITARFISNNINNASGWEASVSCNTLCQDITAAFDSLGASHLPNDSGYIDICEGEMITFSGYGLYPYNNMTYDQADSTSIFVWEFSDGSFDTGQVVTHLFDSVMGYDVNLHITDDHGCSSTNSIGIRVRTGGNPLRRISPLPELCIGDTVSLTIGESPVDHLLVKPIYHKQSASLSYDSLTFIPDGGASGGQCYTASVTFNLFDPNQTVLDSLDILAVHMNAEHSWVGDLKISLICPTGQSVILKDYIQNGGADLGQPNFSDCLLPWCVNQSAQNPPGNGWTYNWSMNTALGVVNDYVTQPQIDSLTYLPEQSFNDLAGCPLNGTWTLEVCDFWAYDNGYVFWWGLEIDPALIPQAWEYTVPIDSMRISGSGIVAQNDSILKVSPPSPGKYAYLMEIWDSYGCAYDTSFTLTVNGLPVTGIPDDTLFCEGLPLPIIRADSLGQGAAYSWTHNGIHLSGNQIYQPPAAGIYVLNVADSNGCTNSDTITIAKAVKPTWTVVTQVATCGKANGLAQVSASDPSVNVLWTTTPPQPGMILTDVLPGTYGFILSDSTCSYTDAVTIGHIPPPAYNIVSKHAENCGKKNGELSLQPKGGSPPYTILWHTLPAQNGLHASGLSQGFVHFTLSDSLCIITDSVHVSHIPGSRAAFTFMPAVAEMPDAIYRFRDDSESGVISWEWDFGDGSGISSERNPVHLYNSADSFLVRLVTSDTAGCPDTTSQGLLVRDFLTIYIPNAFTPNGDGLNEVFGPSGYNIEVESFEMVIFDRWGRQVFYSGGISETWDGRMQSSGDLVPAGAYVYRILLKARHRPLQQFKGTVTIY